MKTSSILLASLVIALAEAANAADYSPPTNGLVAWWRGETNALDSARNHHGSLLSGVTFEPGVFGQAFSFAGTANRVFVPDHPDFQITNSITVAAWIYPRASSWNVFDRSASIPGSLTYGFGLDGGGNFEFLIKGAPLSPTKETVSFPIAFNQWRHVAATLEGNTGDMRLYFDGALVAQKNSAMRPGSLDLAQQSTGLTIGNDWVSAGFPFVGLVDELVVYSRALSSNEVQYLVSGIVSNVPPQIVRHPQGQVGYWGKSVTFAAKAEGDEPLVYLWQKENIPIPWATNASLTLGPLDYVDAGSYRVVVTNAFGFVQSEAALLAVNPSGVSIGLYPGLTIDGVVGKTYSIQYVTNVTHTNAWVTLTNLTLSQAVQLWIDTTADVTSPENPKRFYRVVTVP